MDYWDETLSPKPDRHGIFQPAGDSTDLVLPYGDQHGATSYPIDSSGDVHPQADSHNGEMPMHPGVAKPGSFK